MMGDKRRKELINRIAEFREKEKRYSENLELVSVFRKKIGTTYLDEKSSQMIFRNISLIAHLERKYALKIEEIVNVEQDTGDESEMAQQILKMFSNVLALTEEHFKHLSHPFIRYISSQEDATEMLAGIKFRSREFNRILMSVSNENAALHGKSLESLLIMPVQQSPRRSMQIHAITKAFQKVYPDCKIRILKDICTLIEKFVSHCNSAIGAMQVKKICRHIVWGKDLLRHVASEEFLKQLRGSSRLPCRYVDSGRLLRRSGFKRYETTYVYLFDDMLVILKGTEKTDEAFDIMFLQPSEFAETNLSAISKKGRFHLKAASLRNRNQMSSTKFQGVTSGETMYWHKKINECLNKKSRLVVDGISKSISKRLETWNRVDSVESIGSVDTDSEEGEYEHVKKEENVSSFLKFQFGAENLWNRDGHGIKAFGISDPYFEIVNRNFDRVIFKSETIRDNLNPKWDEAKIPIQKIRGAMLSIRVWDLDPKKSDYLGEVHTTWTELCSLPQGSKLKLHDAETDHKHDIDSGNLILLMWEIC